jgi:hypothetical protein
MQTLEPTVYARPAYTHVTPGAAGTPFGRVSVCGGGPVATELSGSEVLPIGSDGLNCGCIGLPTSRIQLSTSLATHALPGVCLRRVRVEDLVPGIPQQKVGEQAEDRTHPAYASLPEQWERQIQAIQRLGIGEAFIRLPNDSVHKVRTRRSRR